METIDDIIRRIFRESIQAKEAFLRDNLERVARVVDVITDALKKGNKILLFGNGGSAADAQHIAAEFMNRFLIERPPLPAIALTTDTSVLTAIANDYGFEQAFARQVQGLGAAGDVLIAYSTSGNSPNVLKAIETARCLGMTVVGFTGASGGRMAALCDVCIRAPHDVSPVIQECHAAAGHTLCLLVEQLLCEGA